MPILCSCSSYRPRIHSLSDIDYPLAGGVQKTSDSIQFIDPSRSYRLLRLLLIFRIEARGRCWDCLAHICEFSRYMIGKGIRGRYMTSNNGVILGRKLSLCGNRASAGLP